MQKNILCDHDYGNRPTDIFAMTPNVPQSEVMYLCSMNYTYILFNTFLL